MPRSSPLEEWLEWLETTNDLFRGRTSGGTSWFHLPYFQTTFSVTEAELFDGMGIFGVGERQWSIVNEQSALVFPERALLCSVSDKSSCPRRRRRLLFITFWQSSLAYTPFSSSIAKRIKTWDWTTDRLDDFLLTFHFLFPDQRRRACSFHLDHGISASLYSLMSETD